MVYLGPNYVDNTAFLYVLIGGAFMGTYPVPIKAPRVLKANANPVVFQSYKSFWVLVGGFLLVLLNYILGHAPAFVLNWWAVASAIAWVPGGLCTIAAVPRLGVAVTMVTNSGTVSVISFLIGWLLLGERMKEHSLYGGRQLSLAPLYLLCTILGMVGLVAAPQISRKSFVFERKVLKSKGLAGSNYGGADAVLRQSDAVSLARKASTDTIVGLALAICSGCFAALQITAVAVGRQTSEISNSCSLSTQDGGCSLALIEEFNTFGSWTASFGLGAIAVTICALASFMASQVSQGQPADEGMAFEQLAGPASLGGLCWVMGALFQTAAVARGGAAVMMPANCTATLITSGLWGLLYYKEVKDWFSGLLWVIAALWTMAAATALSHERA